MKIIIKEGIFMAHGPGIVPCLGFGGKGRPRRIPKPSSLRRININLECPICHIKLRRADVKIWIKRNKGECPACFKIVDFMQIKKPGPVVGSTYTPTIKDEDLQEMIEIVKQMKHPCKCLTIRDLEELTGQPPIIINKIRRFLGYVSHKGRKSYIEELRRTAVLTLVLNNYELPDLKWFKDPSRILH